MTGGPFFSCECSWSYVGADGNRVSCTDNPKYYCPYYLAVIPVDNRSGDVNHKL